MMVHKSRQKGTKQGQNAPWNSVGAGNKRGQMVGDLSRRERVEQETLIAARQTEVI